MSRIFSTRPDRLFASSERGPITSHGLDLAQRYMHRENQSGRPCTFAQAEEALQRYAATDRTMPETRAPLPLYDPPIRESHNLTDSLAAKRMTDLEMKQVSRYAERNWLGWDVAMQDVLGPARYAEVCHADMASTEYKEYTGIGDVPESED